MATENKIPKLKWGMIDKAGNIQQNDCTYFNGRVVGQITDNNYDEVVNELTSHFETLQNKYLDLEKSIQSANAKIDYLIQIDGLIEYLPQVDALGDFETLMSNLEELKSEIIGDPKDNLQQKEEICAEVDKLNSSDNWINNIGKIREFQKKWESIGPVPKTKNKSIEQRFQLSIREFYSHYRKQLGDKEQNHIQEKEEICKKAEKLSTSRSWNTTSEELQQLQKDWHKIGKVSHEMEEEMWGIFQGFVDKFYTRRHTYYDKIEQRQRENLMLKEKFCSLAEEILSSIDWNHAEFSFHKLEEDWKIVGPVPKENTKDLRDRFQKSVKAFNKLREEHQEEIAQLQKDNFEKKEQLCKQAEEFSNSNDWKTASQNIDELFKEWKSIGFVPKDKEDKIWKRFRGALNIFYKRRKDNFKEIKKQQHLNLEKKEILCAKAEELSTSEDYQKTTNEIIKLQKEWKTIGFVPKENSDEIWKRFQTATQSFFDRRNKHLEIEFVENLKKKTLICESAEKLSKSTDWKETAGLVKELQKEWKQLGPVPKENEDAIWKRFQDATHVFFENRNKFYQEQDKDWQKHTGDLENICKIAENIASSEDWKKTSKKFEDLEKEWTVVGFVPDEVKETIRNRFDRAKERFTKRWNFFKKEQKEGFYKNLEKKIKLCEEIENLDFTKDALKQSINRTKEIQEEWKTIGHVPWKQKDEIWKRFRSACDRIFRVSRAERETQFLDWQKRLHDVLKQKKEQHGYLKRSIEYDERNQSSFEKSVKNVDADWKADLLKLTQQDRNSEIDSKLDSKKKRLAKLEHDIKDIEKKLK
ncbi:MAG: DUF349 domain-containing protein [Candidatus Marinimicrobia bacterium]|nr:DUF349 domain-containing protein [Candidatus Neomarinimicrobiota bacterium]